MYIDPVPAREIKIMYAQNFVLLCLTLFAGDIANNAITSVLLICGNNLSVEQNEKAKPMNLLKMRDDYRYSSTNVCPLPSLAFIFVLVCFFIFFINMSCKRST